MQAPLAIVDLETTGSDPAADRVTEIAVLHAEGDALTAQWSTLINPGAAIPGAIQALTGITQDMAAAAPRFGQIAHELYERLAGGFVVALWVSQGVSGATRYGFAELILGEGR